MTAAKEKPVMPPPPARLPPAAFGPHGGALFSGVMFMERFEFVLSMLWYVSLLALVFYLVFSGY